MGSVHDSVFYPYYRNLNPKQRGAYDEIFPHLEQAEKEFRLTGDYVQEDIFKAMKAIYADHPEIFWIDGSSQVGSRAGKAEIVKPGYNGLTLMLQSKRKALQKVVDDYIEGTKGLGMCEKEKYVHDRMVREITYKFNTYDQTAYAALVDKKAVCAGYTRAFQLIMQQMKIPCYHCTGTANGKGKWEPHSWNLLRLNLDWVNTDVTWNDCFEKLNSNVVSYTYFNCPDTTIAKNHKRGPESEFLPKCVSTKYTIQNVAGDVCVELEQIKQVGVTIDKVIKTKLDFMTAVGPLVKRDKKGTIKFSFAAHGKIVVDSGNDWFKDVMKMPGSYTGGWKLAGKSTDFKNGWYRVEYEIKLV